MSFRIKLTSAENIFEDRLLRLITESGERWKTNEKLIETNAKSPPINCLTFKHIQHTVNILGNAKYSLA